MIDVVVWFGLIGTVAVIVMMIVSYFIPSLNEEEFYDSRDY